MKAIKLKLLRVFSNRILYFILFIAFISIESHCQSEEIDQSYTSDLTSSLSVEKLTKLYELAWEYRNSDPSRAYEYAKEAGQWVRDLEKNYTTAELCVNIGYIHVITKDDYNKAMQYFKRAMKIADYIEEKDGMKIAAKVQEAVGLINYRLQEYEIAIECYDSAAKLYVTLALSYNISNCYRSISMIYEKMGDKRKAEIYQKRETANNNRINYKNLKKNAPVPVDENQMVKIEDYDNFYE